MSNKKSKSQPGKFRWQILVEGIKRKYIEPWPYPATMPNHARMLYRAEQRKAR